MCKWWQRWHRRASPPLAASPSRQPAIGPARPRPIARMDGVGCILHSTECRYLPASASPWAGPLRAGLGWASRGPASAISDGGRERRQTEREGADGLDGATARERQQVITQIGSAGEAPLRQLRRTRGRGAAAGEKRRRGYIPKARLPTGRPPDRRAECVAGWRAGWLLCVGAGVLRTHAQTAARQLIIYCLRSTPYSAEFGAHRTTPYCVGTRTLTYVQVHT